MANTPKAVAIEISSEQFQEIYNLYRSFLKDNYAGNVKQIKADYQYQWVLGVLAESKARAKSQSERTGQNIEPIIYNGFLDTLMERVEGHKEELEAIQAEDEAFFAA